MAELPSGSVTFLFTDIEGSTKLWEQDPEAMREALARHDALSTALIAQHGGTVIKSRGEGDSLFAVFHQTHEAAAAALALQRAFLSECWPTQGPLRVRMALHTGEAQLREGDYYGPPINHCARLRDAAHGGQVLLSQSTVKRVFSSLPEGTHLQSLGVHRLRDLAIREPIFQLIAPGLPAAFPPLNTLDVAFRRGLRRAAAVGGTVVTVLAALALVAVDQAHRARLRQQELRRSLYAADMGAAFHAWEEGNVQAAVDLLEAHQPQTGEKDLRGFEWRYLWGCCHSDARRTLTGHTAEVRSVAFSPDGQWVASGSADRTVRLWDARSGQERATLKGHTGEVNSVAFSPTGKLLASASDDHIVRLWNAAMKQAVTTLIGHQSEVKGVAFSPDGSRLASADNEGQVKLWEGGGGFTGSRDQSPGQWHIVQTLRVQAPPGIQTGLGWVAFSPNGRFLAAGGSDEMARWWDLTTGREVAAHSTQGGYLYAGAFSPDGKLLATGTWNPTVQLWDVLHPWSRRPVAAFQAQRTTVTGVAFSSDGKTLATTGWDYTVKLWDRLLDQPAPREVATFRGHRDRVTSIAFSPDGQTLATGSADRTVKLWGVAAHQEADRLVGHTHSVGVLEFSRDSKMLVTGSYDKTVRLWDVATGLPKGVIKSFAREIAAVALSPDGKTVSTVTGAWNYRGPRELQLWSVNTQRLIATLGRGEYGSVTFSPDGKTLASGGSDLRFWDVASRKELAVLKHPSGDLAFSPDGKSLAAASNDSIMIWDVATRRARFTLKGHTQGVNRMAFSLDGQTLASGSFDGTIRLWDVTAGRPLFKLEAMLLVYDVAFSPDGRTLASLHQDHSLKLWNLDQRREVASIKNACGIGEVAFSPDGRSLATIDQDGTVLLRRAPTFAETDGPSRAR